MTTSDIDAAARSSLAESVLDRKAVCVHRYDDVIARATTPQELVDGVAERIVRTVAEDTALHADWYDLRQLSVFDESLREAVETIDGWLQDMVWRIVSRYAELARTAPAMTPGIAYAVLDEIFVKALQAYRRGALGVLEELEAQVRQLMPMLLATQATA